MKEKTARIKVPESVISELYKTKADADSITQHVIKILLGASKGSNEHNQTRPK